MADPFSSDAAFLVDARGVLMKEKKLLPEYLGLPLISGCTSESLEPGKVVESLRSKGGSGTAAHEHAQFHADAFPDSRDRSFERLLSFVTDKNRTRVAFGFENLDTQLQRLEQFLIYADDSKQELATVNLLVQRNIPVTFGQTGRRGDQRDDRSGRNSRDIMKAMPAAILRRNSELFRAPKADVSRKTSSRELRAKLIPRQVRREVRRAVAIDHGKKN